jgi:hypothetical protein
MSNFLMWRDLNPDVKYFDSKLQNLSTPELEQPILMSKFLMQHRFDHD